MPVTFTKATKEQARLRMALIGPSGSGKTYTALRIATALKNGGRVALIDTERGSASKYADLFDFDTLSLAEFSPDRYIEAIAAAQAAKFDVLIIDSLSHAWSSKGGILEFVDQATARSNSHNAYSEGWRKATPLHNRLVDSIIQADLHIIVTMRTKTEYVMEKDERTGKAAPRKIGLAPIQRDGLEYEFDVVGDINTDHVLVISKTRCPALTDQIFPLAGEDMAAVLKAWLGNGTAPKPKGPAWIEPIVKAGEEPPAKPEPDIDAVFPRNDPPPAPPAKPRPQTSKVAVKTNKWSAAAVALAQEHPYYQTDGRPNFYKMLAAAAKHAGVTEITDANLPYVIAALTAHAVAEMEPKPGDVVEPDGLLL